MTNFCDLTAANKKKGHSGINQFTLSTYIMGKYLNILARFAWAKRSIVGKSRLNLSRSERVVIAGWEASGSTFLYQVSNLLGLKVQKIHGTPDNNTDFTLFTFRDPRDVISSHARRFFGEVWQLEGSETALLTALEWFEETGHVQALYESSGMPNVILIRYENYFLKNEDVLIVMIADQFLIPLDDKKLAFILNHTSIEANMERSKRFDEFKKWDKDTFIHGIHISNKGLVGGWKKHFTPLVEQRVKESLGKILITLGYEQDYNWTSKE